MSINDKVKCAICGREEHILVEHITRKHELLPTEYLDAHPGAPLWSGYGAAKIQEYSKSPSAKLLPRPRKTVPLKTLFPEFGKKRGFEVVGDQSIFESPGPLTPKRNPHYLFPEEQTLDMLAILDKTVRNRPFIKGWSGCLAGDTMVDINRAGRSFKIRLDELVMKENGVAFDRNGAQVTWDSRIKTQVRSRDEYGSVRLFDLSAAIYSGVKETYEVTFEDGRIVRGTAIHPFWTTTGWKTLRELRVGSQVWSDGGQTTNGRKKPPYLTWRIAIAREAAHRLTVEADMNGLALATYLKRRRAGDMSLRRLGEEQVVHHKDGDTLNNTLSNLEVLDSQADHARQHGHDSAWRNVTAITVPLRVKSIREYREEPTFDLTVNGPENFLANGTVVHNTGKTELCFNLAAILNAEAMEWNADAFQQRSSLIGQWTVKDGATVWEYGILPRAMKRGVWLIINEIDTIDPHTLNILKPTLEDPPRLTILENGGEVIHAHPDFRIIATANTWARGDSSGMFVNTHVQSDADARRWSARILLDYMDVDAEEAMLANYFPKMDPKVISKFVLVGTKVRDAFKAGKIDKTFSPAELVNWCENYMVLGKGVHHAARLSFLNSLEPDVTTAIGEMVNAVFGQEDAR